MTIPQTLMLLAGTCLLGGCTATLTPQGDIYTEAYWPAETVVVESYTPTVVVPVYEPRPLGPIARAPRPHPTPAVHHSRPFGHIQHSFGHRPSPSVRPSGGTRPNGGSRPNGGGSRPAGGKGPSGKPRHK